MQKVIAKYGLAAHLALLAVAPLFLYPFVGETTIAVVVLWLCLPAAAWTVFEPSVRTGESTGDARRRVLRSIRTDPLFWMTLALVVMFGVWALNTGIALAYDAEKSQWRIAEAVFPILPGAVGWSGFLPFAGSVALMVILQACRHSVGRAARMAFLLMASFLAGLAATVVLLQTFFTGSGVEGICKAAASAYSYAGFSHGLMLACGVVALATAFERRWRMAMLLLLVAIGGNAAGVFVLSPTYQVTGCAAAFLIVLICAFAYCHCYAPAGSDFKLLVLVGIGLALGGLIVALALPSEAFNDRIVAYQELAFFPEKFWERRTMLSAIALKSWVAHLWTGTGISSFAFDFRFNAAEADWALLPLGIVAVPNGWWWLLAERGLIGMALYVLPFGFLLFTFSRRLANGIKGLGVPHPACLLAPITLGLLVADGFFDCSPVRVEVILITGAMMAVSAASLPRKRQDNG